MLLFLCNNYIFLAGKVKCHGLLKFKYPVYKVCVMTPRDKNALESPCPFPPLPVWKNVKTM